MIIMMMMIMMTIMMLMPEEERKCALDASHFFHLYFMPPSLRALMTPTKSGMCTTDHGNILMLPSNKQVE